MYVNTKGVILRDAHYKENDKILTVLTDSLGKITVKGRGVKRIKNKLFNICNMFVYSEMTLFKSGDRYILDSANLIEQFYELRCDISRLSLANYFSELCSRLTTEGVESCDLLSLLLNALYILSKSDRKLSAVKAAFELKAMEYAGYMPDLDGCDCEKSEKYYFDLEKGQLKCGACVGALSAQIAVLSPSVLSAMRYVAESDSKRLFSFDLPDKELVLFNRITEAYIKTQLDCEFQTLIYYNKLTNTL